MKKIKFLSLIALVSVGAIFLSNCGPETVEAPKPIVNFLADAKYVSANSALAASTDFTIGLTATHSSTLSTLTITKAVNGGAAVIEKEEELSGNTLAIYEYKGVTEASVGTEIYTFTVADKSGNSTSKTITITNIGDPGLELIDLTVDNNGDFFRVYNFRAPTGFLGAYYLGQGPMAYNDPNSQKDIQDSTAVGEKWVGRWTSRNGSTFKKMSADKWNSITNDATIVAAWAAATGETSVIDLKEGDAYLVNIKGTSTKFAAVLITALDKTVAPKEFAQFVYKIQQ
ncbi:MAG TPA: hypothetical protein DEQ56_01690 [Bacteroidetes bacterium]|jgi:hypothetical protein|nr:hypothetical protein [Bacteroidota bacterium]